VSARGSSAPERAPAASPGRSRPVQEAQAYADDNSLLFMETSAKTAMNVNDLFLAIGEAPAGGGALGRGEDAAPGKAPSSPSPGERGCAAGRVPVPLPPPAPPSRPSPHPPQPRSCRRASRRARARRRAAAEAWTCTSRASRTGASVVATNGRPRAEGELSCPRRPRPAPRHAETPLGTDPGAPLTALFNASKAPPAPRRRTAPAGPSPPEGEETLPHFVL